MTANGYADVYTAECGRLSVLRMIQLHAYGDGAAQDYFQIPHCNQA